MGLQWHFLRRIGTPRLPPPVGGIVFPFARLYWAGFPFGRTANPRSLTLARGVLGTAVRNGYSVIKVRGAYAPSAPHRPVGLVTVALTHAQERAGEEWLVSAPCISRYGAGGV